MKNTSRLSVLTLAAFTACGLAFTASADEAKSKPCKEILSACEAGGYVKGAHKTTGKGLFKDCLQKLLAGEAVAGVTVSSDQVAACKAKKEKRAATKDAKSSS